jgi:hypothetical protein
MTPVIAIAPLSLSPPATGLSTSVNTRTLHETKPGSRPQMSSRTSCRWERLRASSKLNRAIVHHSHREPKLNQSSADPPVIGRITATLKLCVKTNMLKRTPWLSRSPSHLVEQKFLIYSSAQAIDCPPACTARISTRQFFAASLLRKRND